MLRFANELNSLDQIWITTTSFGAPIEESCQWIGTCSTEGPQSGQGWSTCPVGRGWRTGACSAWRQDGSKHPTTDKEVIKTQSQPRHRGAWREGERQRVYVEWQWSRLDTRRNLFPMETVELWSSSIIEVVLSLSLQVFKTWLDKVLRKLFWSCPYPCLSRRLDQRPAGV